MEELLMKQIYADEYRQIGLKIAYYRKLRGLTQEELAERVGLTPAFIDPGGGNHRAEWERKSYQSRRKRPS